MILFRRYFGIVCVLTLSIFAILPLFNQGFFPMHDDTQVARVFEMGKALRDGMFPVRWVPDLGYGYGYPIFNFYAPLAYYVGGVFNVAGFDALIATKMMMGLGIILSGIFMYFLAREFWGNLGGIVSSLFYVYSIYHAIDIYARGDVAEFWAYAFIPIVFYGLWKVYKEKKWHFVVVGSIGFAGLILSHNLTAMMTALFILVLLLILSFLSIRKREINKIFYLLSIIFLGILLSAFYWIPAILEMNYTNVLSQIGGGADFRDHFVCPIQLWSSHWGFGGSTSGCIDGMSFMIGKIYIISAILSFTLLFIKIFQKKIGKEIFIALLCFFGFLITTFFTLEISKSLWEAIPLMAFFQYPWRFLLLASFFSSVLAGSLILLTKSVKFKFLNYLTVTVLIILLLFLNLKFFQPQNFVNKTASDFTSDRVLKWETSRISDEYMPKEFNTPDVENDIPQNKIESQNPSVKIDSIIEKTQLVTANVSSQKGAQIKINLAYFPAWKISLDGKNIPFQISAGGVEFVLPSGKHFLEAGFQQTMVENLANALSLIGIVIMILGIIASRKRSTL